MPSTPSYNQALPRCEGPKLRPFPRRKAAVQITALLSDLDSDGHAHVFEASIGSRTYALKVFKFYDDDEHLAALDNEECELVPLSLLHAHSDPFYNECRAFGRFEESRLNGKVAVCCYGHMPIPAELEDEIDRQFDTEGAWGRTREDFRKSASERRPLRAIVKDLVREETPLTDKTVKKMLRNLKRIRKLGVYPMDIRARNYKAGLLLDLSSAFTEPHFLFKIRPRHEERFRKHQDLIRFDRMVQDAGVVTWERALPNQKYIANLRPRPGKNKVSKR